MRLGDLTYWSWDKFAVLLQTTCSNTFSWKRMAEFRLIFHCILFPRVQLIMVQIMAWRRVCDKPLSEPPMTFITDDICGTQWVNDILQTRFWKGWKIRLSSKETCTVHFPDDYFIRLKRGLEANKKSVNMTTSGATRRNHYNTLQYEMRLHIAA